MRLLSRVVGGALLAGSLLFATAALTPSSSLTAHPRDIALWDLGPQVVSGTTWQFDQAYSLGAGAWESVTITNFDACWVGPNDPRAGTAHAGAVWWFTELTPQPPSQQGRVFTGHLKGSRSQATGDVTITTTDDGSGPVTRVQVTLSGDDLSFFQDDSLDVCLLGSS